MEFKATFDVNPRLKELGPAALMQAAEMKTIRDQVDFAFRDSRKRTFATEGASDGAKYPPLSPAYKKQKRRTHPGRKIMSKSGRLRKSLTTKGAGHVADFTAGKFAKVTVGTSVDHAAYHVKPKGFSNPFYNRNLPDRDVMRHTRKQEQRYLGIIGDYWRETKMPRLQKILNRGSAEM